MSSTAYLVVPWFEAAALLELHGKVIGDDDLGGWVSGWVGGWVGEEEEERRPGWVGGCVGGLRRRRRRRRRRKGGLFCWTWVGWMSGWVGECVGEWVSEWVGEWVGGRRGAYHSSFEHCGAVSHHKDLVLDDLAL